MFRIRESFPDADTVQLWFDGRLSDQALETAQEQVYRYLDEGKHVVINLSNLNQVGWAGKRFIQDIREKVKLEEPPEYIKAGM